jgi:hypothetical protein
MTDNLRTDNLAWSGFLRAIETSPVDVRSILGASGLEHPLLAVGADTARKRMVVVSGAGDAREAALVLADLQASFKSVQILMVRSTNADAISTNGDADQMLGLCFLRQGDGPEAEIFGDAAGDARIVLAQQNILQYFFPAPDHLALALIERWCFATIPQAIDQLVRAPDLGHPFGPPEIVEEYETFTEMIVDLHGRGLVEVNAQGLEVTEAGRALRAEIRNRPREALADKLLNRLSASLAFKPIWLPAIRGQNN